MIQIRVTRDQIESRITADYSMWKEWSDVKPLFLELQQFKCGYCEGEIGGRENAQKHRDLYEQDVEHYRPKGAVAPWICPEAARFGFPAQQGPSTGYPWLRLDPHNYLAACRTCNSAYKKNYFPIRTALDTTTYGGHPTVAVLAAEQPFLIFPVGDLEDRVAEDYVTYEGPVASPHPSLLESEFAYWRAYATIHVTGLNREDLYSRRSDQLLTLAKIWCVSRGVSPDEANRFLDSELSTRREFLGCKRAFLQLCQDFPVQAQQLAMALAEKFGTVTDCEILRDLWPLK